MPHTFSLTIYRFDELDTKIQDDLILKNGLINLQEGNSPLEDWIEEVTRTIEKDSGLTVTLAYDYDKNDLLGIMFIPSEDKPEDGHFYSIRLDKTPTYYLRDDYHNETQVQDEKTLKKLEAIFVWFFPVYEAFIEKMKVWCSLKEVRKTLASKWYLKDGTFVSVNNLARELNHVLQNQKPQNTDQ